MCRRAYFWIMLPPKIMRYTLRCLDSTLTRNVMLFSISSVVVVSAYI